MKKKILLYLGIFAVLLSNTITTYASSDYDIFYKTIIYTDLFPTSDISKVDIVKYDTLFTEQNQIVEETITLKGKEDCSLSFSMLLKSSINIINSYVFFYVNDTEIKPIYSYKDSVATSKVDMIKEVNDYTLLGQDDRISTMPVYVYTLDKANYLNTFSISYANEKIIYDNCYITDNDKTNKVLTFNFVSNEKDAKIYSFNNELEVNSVFSKTNYTAQDFIDEIPNSALETYSPSIYLENIKDFLDSNYNYQNYESILYPQDTFSTQNYCLTYNFSILKDEIKTINFSYRNTCDKDSLYYPEKNIYSFDLYSRYLMSETFDYSYTFILEKNLIENVLPITNVDDNTYNIITKGSLSNDLLLNTCLVQHPRSANKGFPLIIAIIILGLITCGWIIFIRYKVKRRKHA